MRRPMLPLLFLILAGTGLFANLPVLMVSLVVSKVGFRSLTVLPWLVLAAAAVDVGRRAFAPNSRWLRPLAVHTQVPQWWGHRYGPWLGSIRYGLRLGLGPATILTTWLWWAGAIGLAINSVRYTLVGVLIFVLVRAAMVIGPSLGVSDGSQMAKRARVLDRGEPITFWFCTVLLGVLALLTIARV